MMLQARPLFVVFFSLFVLLQAFLIPLSASQITNKVFSDCFLTEQSCGSYSLDISYPFRLSSMPAYCGHPNFEIKCKNSIWEVDISGTRYRASFIDYNNQQFTVLNLDYLTNSCPQAFANTTIDFSLLGYTDYSLNVTLYFNCSPLASPSNLRNLSCLANNGYQSYYTVANVDGPQPVSGLVERCSSVILIPTFAFNAVPLETGKLDFLSMLQFGFDLRWMVGRGLCKGCKDSGGVCGYGRGFPDGLTCFCPDGNSTTGSCLLEGSQGNTSEMKIIIGSTIGSIGFILACCVLIYFMGGWGKFSNFVIFWKKNFKNDQNIEAFLKKYGSLAPKRYTYSDVKKITKDFHDRLGQGGYGTVFRGTLNDGREVAVKVLSESKGNGEEFVNEVASIGKTSHVNIVSLLGFCSEGSKRALIYDFVCNGSLDKFIYSEKPKTTLSWEKLYEIAVGIARGLEYLHRGCNTKIVHFDIKPHNILLDQDFCPKIADFGLAQFCLQKDSILYVAGTRGTIGYIAPEVFSRQFGVVSSKSDVYSYGTMVLEMIGGRKVVNKDADNTSEIYFPHWIYDHVGQHEDLKDLDVTDETEETARKMILVGLWCIQTLPQNRPSMSRVLDMLEGSVSDLQMPPKPYLSSPLQFKIDSSSSTL